MSTVDLATIAFDLPPEERLDLARRLVESVITPPSLEVVVEQGIRRIEEVLSGEVKGLTASEFRTAL